MQLTQKMNDVVEGWKRKLLQMDRSNARLYFKASRSTVKIESPNCLDIVESLEKARAGLSFNYLEQSVSRTRRVLRDPLAIDDAGEEEIAEPLVRPGVIDADCPDVELPRRLGNLMVRAKTWEQEQGLSVLFLALGFLKYLDKDGEEATAPLLLLPVTLDRASPRDHFIIHESDEDAEVNDVLSVALKKLTGRELPRNDGLSVGDYLSDVRKLFADQADMAVVEDVYLSIFSFSKQAMVRDLERVQESGTDSVFVRTLAGDESASGQITPLDSAQDFSGDSLAGGRLDDLISMAETRVILDADFSQMIAISKALDGRSLVVHGPPGTGKSQTISNIVASLIGAGKKVLFVSEKTAALDVVKKRMEEKGLGIFCLDLHSERGKKTNVYAQLNESLITDKSGKRARLELNEIEGLRDRLNAYTRMLHTPIAPLGITPFRAYGRLSVLHELPTTDFQIAGIDELSSESRRTLLELCSRMTGYAKEFSGHDSNDWRSLKNLDPSLQFADRLKLQLQEFGESTSELMKLGNKVTSTLGLERFESADSIPNLTKIRSHFTECPEVPIQWLVGSQVRDMLSVEANTQKKAASRRSDLLSDIADFIDWENTTVNWLTISKSLEIARTKHQLLDQFLGKTWNQEIAEDARYIESRISTLLTAATEIESDAQQLARDLDLRDPKNLPQVKSLQVLASQIASLGEIPRNWVTDKDISELLHLFKDIRDLCRKLDSEESELVSLWDSSIVDTLPNDVIVRYKGYREKRFKWLSSGFRKDQRLLKSFWQGSDKPSLEQEISCVNQISEISRMRDLFESDATLLHSRTKHERFSGRKTDWDNVISDLTTFEIVKKNWESGVSSLLNAVSVRPNKLASTELHQKLSISLDTIDGVADQLTGLKTDSSPLNDCDPSDLTRHLAALQEIVVEVKQTTEIIGSEIESSKIDGKRFLQLIEHAAELVKAEEVFTDMSEILIGKFQSRFTGLKTNWESITQSLNWLNKFLELTGPINDTGPIEKMIRDRKMGQSTSKIVDEVQISQTRFLLSSTALDKQFDVSLLEWGEWASAELDTANDWSEKMIDVIDDAQQWIAYRRLSDQIDELLGTDAVASIRAVVDEASDFERVVDKQLIEAWVDWIHKDRAILAEFSSFDHESLRDQFTKLDSALGLATAKVIHSDSISRYPTRSQAIKSGGLALVHRELNKKSRRAPVRTLFRQAPEVIQALKPCVLMSPLAVSKFLALGEDGNSLEFDAVIFDEASQVFPEDAVPAMLRGKQIIFAGDQKQMPPSNWFRSADTGEDYENDDELTEDSLEGMESILDVAVSETNLFDEAHLLVHYRSKDPSLIEFSNRHFYAGNPLLTFPANGKNPEYGIQDIFVQNGIYKPGSAQDGRTNRNEAERVVDLIFDHFRTRPTSESLGVVTFNQPQMDLTMNLVEIRRRKEPDVEVRFSSEIDEPFFVKNLENVQGDERDHIILSVTYGPVGESGEVPQRFGGLNRAGGERRLNVAISRSRKRMSVVRSFHPSKISTDTTGPKLLRRFLEHSIDPEGMVIDPEVDPTAETDSPFEDAVLAALESKGYKVAKQVGTLGYRIDLAIHSEDGQGFDLGIECDGATYHRAPAARDRDWQRQQILEDLGWNIHRIWSTAWFRNPNRELAKIEDVLRLARVNDLNQNGDSGSYSMGNCERQDEHSVDDDSEEYLDFIQFDKEVEEVADITEFAQYQNVVFNDDVFLGELKYASYVTIREMTAQVAKKEGPVHIDLVIERIRTAYNIGKVVGSTREQVRHYIELTISAKVLLNSGEFIWAENSQLSRVPRKNSKESKRKTEQISPWELEEGVKRAKAAMYGGSRDQVIRVTANMFGITRVGPVVKEVIGKAYDVVERTVS